MDKHENTLILITGLNVTLQYATGSSECNEAPRADRPNLHSIDVGQRLLPLHLGWALSGQRFQNGSLLLLALLPGRHAKKEKTRPQEHAQIYVMKTEGGKRKKVNSEETIGFSLLSTSCVHMPAATWAAGWRTVEL